MATKSLLKDVEIKSKKLSKEFANALEISVSKSEENTITRETADIKCTELKGEEIKRFFDMK